ncbi:MAG TPA: FAD-dependent thymidylate synthase [Candidatus Nanoarchaeia archaeon]|nr:FAD-dependent thymidylate synthase [Candidatus Nanoarchaeia archaeon]
MAKYESLDAVPANIREKLGNYVTNVGGNTFVISGLPPEVTGGVLARYSRAPTGLQLTLVNEFLDDNGDPIQAKGTGVLERVLVGFGDDSVGELEGVHIGIEGISQIGTKWVEDRRIGGSPIEQSTRYVRYDQKDAQGNWKFLHPREVQEAGLGIRFKQVNDRAFEVYSNGIRRLMDHFKRVLPEDQYKIKVRRGEEEVEVGKADLQGDDEVRAFRNAYTFAIRCAALDVGRCVLPASTLTQLGVYGNGRFMSGVLSFLKSQGLKEAQDRANELEIELAKVIPTFIKRNKANLSWARRDERMYALARELTEGMTPETQPVLLVSRADHLDEVVAQILFPYTNVSLRQIQERVHNYTRRLKEEVIAAYVGERESRRDRTGRSFEAGYPYTFEIVGGFAEYRDLERHRMVTQQRQRLTTELGFIMPPEMREIGLEQQVEEVVAQMEGLNSDIRHADLEEAAQYATLFNHRMRFFMGLNARELQHLTELRTGPAGHFSYRAVAMEMARQALQRDPWLGEALRFVDYSDPENRITRAKEQSKIAGRNIAKGIDDTSDLV